MNSLKHLIYSDLDGTLLDHFTYQYAAATDTLKLLKNANIPVILNTSKTFAEVIDIHKELDLDTPFIVENGAAIYMPTTTFAIQPKGTKLEGRYWVKSFSQPVEHWLTLLTEQTKEFTPFFQTFSNLSDKLLSQITGLTIEKAKQAKQRQFGEPIQWLSDNTTKKAFIKHMQELGANVVEGGRFLHVSGNCDKGQALQWLTEQYQEDFHRHFDNTSLCTIALGDGENDNTMLEAADIAVQIKSPIHQFPTLNRDKVTHTQCYGPEGWAEAVQFILAKQLLNDEASAA